MRLPRRKFLHLAAALPRSPAVSGVGWGAEEVLKGQDIVIVAMPTSDLSETFVMTRKEITH